MVIDLDPQSNAAYVLRVDPITSGTSELLTGGAPSPLEATQELHVLPAQRKRTQGTTLPLEQILDRETDTRPLQSQHVTQLAESIAVLELIEPLVVDNQRKEHSR